MKAENMVIDGDLMKCLEKFDPKDLEQVKAKYESMGKWDDVAVDCSGDIVLYKDLDGD